MHPSHVQTRAVRVVVFDILKNFVEGRLDPDVSTRRQMDKGKSNFRNIDKGRFDRKSQDEVRRQMKKRTLKHSTQSQSVTWHFIQ